MPDSLDHSTPLPLLYRLTAADDSLLAGDTLLLARSGQKEAEPWGMAERTMPDAPHRSDAVAIGLLVCFLLICAARGLYRNSLRTALADFFLPTNNSRKGDAAEGGNEGRRMLVALLFCIEGAVAIVVASQALGYVALLPTPWLTIGIYAGILALYVAAKQMLYHFVHSVFFSEAQQRQWREHYTFLFTAESLLLFPLLLLFVFLQMDLKTVAISAIIVLLFVKITLLFKCFSTFFVKTYGFLPLFVYLCTLEAAPAVVLWKIFVEITQGLNLT